MADETIRELERRFRESGDPADEAAVLQARTRIEDEEKSISQWVISAAAKMRYEAAMLLVNRDVKPVQHLTAKELHEEYKAIFGALNSVSPQAAMRAALLLLEKASIGYENRKDLLQPFWANVTFEKMDFQGIEIFCALVGVDEEPIPVGTPDRWYQLNLRSLVRFYIATFGPLVDTEVAYNDLISSATELHEMLTIRTEDTHEVYEAILEAFHAEVIPFLFGYGDPLKDRMPKVRAKREENQ